MVARLLLPGAGSYSAPLNLSDESRQHWQQAFDINFATSSAVVLNVNRLAWDQADVNQTLARVTRRGCELYRDGQPPIGTNS